MSVDSFDRFSLAYAISTALPRIGDGTTLPMDSCVELADELIAFMQSIQSTIEDTDWIDKHYAAFEKERLAMNEQFDEIEMTLSTHRALVASILIAKDVVPISTQEPDSGDIGPLIDPNV